MSSLLRTRKGLSVTAALALCAGVLGAATLSGSANAETIDGDGYTFDVSSNGVGYGLYQSAYSERNDVLWVTSAVGTPPVKQSALTKVDPDTLEVLATYTPPTLDAGTANERVEAVYGVAVDDKNNTVWVTATREDAVAVYDQATGAHLATIPGVTHARDIVVDAERGFAYASEAQAPGNGGGKIAKIDANTYEHLYDISLGANTQPMALELVADANTSKLYTVDLGSGDVFTIDNLGQSVSTTTTGHSSVSQSGIAVDSVRNRAYVASQGLNPITRVDLGTNQVDELNGPTAGSLNAAYDAADDLVFTTQWWGAGVDVFDGESGDHVANLPVGAYPNHVQAASNGAVYVAGRANSYGGQGGQDKIWKIEADADEPTPEPTEEPTTEPTEEPTTEPTEEPTTEPTTEPTPGPGTTTGTVDLDVTIPEAGTLTLALNSSELSLGQARYRSRTNAYTANGLLPIVSVTDTRPANPGWSLVGKTTDFTNTTGNTIAGTYLGWTPELIDAAEGQHITPGDTVEAGTGIGTGATLASAANGAGRGTAQLGAQLNLRAPNTTQPGTYTATITLTLS